MSRENKNKKNKSPKKIFWCVLLCTVFLGVAATFVSPRAQDVIDVDLNILSGADFKNTNTVDILPNDFVGTTRLAMMSTKDSKEELFVVGLGGQAESSIKIFNVAGALVRSWTPFNLGKINAVSLAVGNLDGDGVEEVVAGAGRGGTPQVRIFDDKGQTKFNNGFFGEEVGYLGGVEVAVGDINKDKRQEIIVASAKNKKNIIKFFDYNGKEVEKSFSFDVTDDFAPGKIAVVDYNQDGANEIMIGASSGNAPYIKIFDKTGKLLKEFLAYKDNFLGGINVSLGILDGQPVIITGAGYSGGPHVRFFNLDGALHAELFSHSKKFLGGINIAYGDINGDGENELLSLPQQINKDGSKYYSKYIDIDLSEQKLRYYQAGILLDQFIISTGRIGMLTPMGEFKTFYKSLRAYSAKYDLYMPFWMAFKPGYGIHELPEWKNGYKEGKNHLGIKVSHGCVRLGVGPAKKLYDWAPVGTPVIIHD